MKYIIMCGGNYDKWQTPRQLTKIKGEPLVARTIRLLRQNAVEDIAISSNSPLFEQFGVEVLKHQNDFHVSEGCESGTWVNAFYPMTSPVCYLFGDVVYSPEAIRKIVETDTESVQFFASAKPFPLIYPKRWAEPFAFKVRDMAHFFESVEMVKKLDKLGMFKRPPIAWELWQVIKGTELNHIVYTNYYVINDYTCDIDVPEDIKYFEQIETI